MDLKVFASLVGVSFGTLLGGAGYFLKSKAGLLISRTFNIISRTRSKASTRYFKHKPK